MIDKDENRAREQAGLQLKSIENFYRAYQFAEDLKGLNSREDLDEDQRKEFDTLLKEIDFTEEHLMDEDSIIEAVREDALDVQVRSDWVNAGEPMEAIEFTILLCTGGPAVRIVGELNEHNEPCRAWLEYQDWGTPWTEYHERQNSEALEWYASQFYFGA